MQAARCVVGRVLSRIGIARVVGEGPCCCRQGRAPETTKRDSLAKGAPLLQTRSEDNQDAALRPVFGP
jgi:hypothetical protein